MCYGADKPDIEAAGVNIVSLRAPNSFLDKFQKSSRVDTNYFVLSGTSMATPICAGVVALILEGNRGMSPDDVKQRLMNGADPWGVNPGTELNLYFRIIFYYFLTSNPQKRLIIHYAQSSPYFNHNEGLYRKIENLIFLYDCFVLNIDRYPLNTNVFMNHVRLYSVDYGASLFFLSSLK